jgi:hypothetical protein
VVVQKLAVAAPNALPTIKGNLPTMKIIKKGAPEPPQQIFDPE